MLHERMQASCALNNAIDDRLLTIESYWYGDLSLLSLIEEFYLLIGFLFLDFDLNKL